MPSLIHRQVSIQRDRHHACPRNIPYVRRHRDGSLWLLVIVGVMISIGIITTSTKSEAVQQVFDRAIHNFNSHEIMSDGLHRMKRDLPLYAEVEKLKFSSEVDVNLTSSELNLHSLKNPKSPRKSTHHKKKGVKGTKSTSSSYFEVDMHDHSISKNMFQYASLLGIASYTGRIPLISHKVNLKQTFNLSAAVDRSHVPKNIHFTKVVVNKIVQPSIRQYGADVVPFTTSVHVAGQLRSWKYFHHVEPLLREEFRISDAHATDVQAVIHSHVKAKYPNSTQDSYPAVVAVYMGRGPYNNVVKKTMQYVKRAMFYFTERFDAHFIFLCTDTKKCQKVLNMHNLSKQSTVMKIPLHSQITPMSVMGAADHVIIGVVESLSWWGAWFNRGLCVYDVAHSEVFKINEAGSKNTTLMHGPSYFLPHWISV